MSVPEDLPPLPRPEDQPTLSVDLAGRYLGLSRGSAYAAAAAGELPTVRFGRRVLVPTAALRRLLGIDPPVPAGAADPPLNGPSLRAV